MHVEENVKLLETIEITLILYNGFTCNKSIYFTTKKYENKKVGHLVKKVKKHDREKHWKIGLREKWYFHMKAVMLTC